MHEKMKSIVVIGSSIVFSSIFLLLVQMICIERILQHLWCHSLTFVYASIVVMIMLFSFSFGLLVLYLGLFFGFEIAEHGDSKLNNNEEKE